MNWFVAISSYVIIWWIVIFAVLPFWVQHADKDDPGHAAGAPANPRLLRKVAITTGIAAVLWLGLFWAAQSDLVNFRGPS
jgi:predicted secreted protein